MVVSLGRDSNNALHKTLSQRRVALMFQDIKQLDLSNFEISHTATDSNKRDKITSIIFRYHPIYYSNLEINDNGC